jgi:hypothetical protein
VLEVPVADGLAVEKVAVIERERRLQLLRAPSVFRLSARRAAVVS